MEDGDPGHEDGGAYITYEAAALALGAVESCLGEINTFAAQHQIPMVVNDDTRDANPSDLHESSMEIGDGQHEALPNGSLSDFSEHMETNNEHIAASQREGEREELLQKIEELEKIIADEENGQEETTNQESGSPGVPMAHEHGDANPGSHDDPEQGKCKKTAKRSSQVQSGSSNPAQAKRKPKTKAMPKKSIKKRVDEVSVKKKLHSVAGHWERISF